jgi:hypothetical protein
MLVEITVEPQQETAPSARDNLLFFRSRMPNPLRAGAFKPSSLDLARSMASRVDPSVPGPVVELGPGTGGGRARRSRRARAGGGRSCLLRAAAAPLANGARPG